MIADRTWRTGWAKPDRKPIHDWAHRTVVLPPAYAQPGRFDVSTSRHLLGPFAAVQDDRIREATWAGAIQTGKSLVVEVSILWALCNSPGPVMWTMQTDDDAREHCNQRFMELLRSVSQIKAMIPGDRHLSTMTEIYFGPFFLTVNGANMNNLQRVSVRWKFNSEVWLWKQGLLAHARGRVSAFEKAGNSKVINESQGGNDGDDFHEAFKSGNQQLWSVRCFGCGQLSGLEFDARMVTDPSKRAGVVWDESARRDDGSWNVGRVAETARWRCRHCGHDHEDTARTRALWNASGEYVAQRPDAPAHLASFRWEGLVARDMGALAAQFIEARRQQKSGVRQAMDDFYRQRRALPAKNEEAAAVVLLKGSGYVLTDEKITAKIANEAERFMTVDRQRDHFWCVVRAWCPDGSSRLLYRSRIETAEQLEQVRERFAVLPQMVFEDSGYFPDGVYSDCVRYGWTALKGSGAGHFSIERNGRRVRRMWSNSSIVQHEGRMIDLYHWASDPVKDVLGKLRSGQGAKWEVPDDAGQEYERQINGDVKKEMVNKKTGRSEWRWVRRHANHYWDCEAMQVAAALMLGILASPAEPDEEKPNENQ